MSRVIGVLPSYDRLTDLLHRLLSSSLDRFSSVSITGKLAGRVGLMNEFARGRDIVLFAGHGKNSALLTASHLGVNPSRYKGHGELLNGHDVRRSNAPLTVFAYCCDSSLSLGDAVASQGGTFLGYRGDLPFVSREDNEQLFDEFRIPVEFVGKKLRRHRMLSKHTKKDLQARYELAIRRLRKPASRSILGWLLGKREGEGDDPSGRLARMALMVHVSMLEFKG